MSRVLSVAYATQKANHAVGQVTLPAAYWDFSSGVLGVSSAAGLREKAVWPGRSRRDRTSAKTVVKKK
jgi:hypothetical protein